MDENVNKLRAMSPAQQRAAFVLMTVVLPFWLFGRLVHEACKGIGDAFVEVGRDFREYRQFWRDMKK